MAKIIAVAFVPAIRIGYYVISRWLQDFAYHIPITPRLFAQAAVITFTLVFLTISYQTVKYGYYKPSEDPAKGIKGL